METYTYKCPGCGAGLEYDAQNGLFVCRTCGQYYKLDNANTEVQDKASVPADLDFLNKKSIFDVDEPEEETGEMDVRIYHCSSCGAEVMTTDTTVSTFCSYCGQSTIMFDRISKEKRPGKIIPFRISKEDALLRAKSKFAKGKYSFTDISEVSIENVKGIYMPYWVYSCEAYVDATVTLDEPKQKKRVYNKTQEFDEIVALDASKRFNDRVSVELNPYDIDRAVKFNMSYLAGYYANKSDVDNVNRVSDAEYFVMNELKQRVLDATPGVQQRQLRELYADSMYDMRRYIEYKVNKSSFDCKKSTYMLLPVYFITFMVAEEKVIILVNGQTGKVVGFVPYNMKKFRVAQVKSIIKWAIIFTIAGALSFRYVPVWWAVEFIGILVYSFLKEAANKKNRFLYYYQEMNSKEMFDLSKKD